MKNQTKINVPTGLAGAILEAATTALAQRRAAPVAEAEVRGCREDARAVAIAVLVALGGNEEKAGLHPRRTRQSEELLSLADELDDEGE